MEGKKGRLSLLGLSQAVQGTSGKGSWNSGEHGSGERQGLGFREGESKGVQEGWGSNFRTGQGWAGAVVVVVEMPSPSSQKTSF